MKNYKFLILVFCINLFSNTNILAQFSAPDDDFIAKKAKCPKCGSGGLNMYDCGMWD